MPELARIFLRGKQVLFNRDLNTKILILSPVNGTHTTLTKDLNDPVAIN